MGVVVRVEGPRYRIDMGNDGRRGKGASGMRHARAVGVLCVLGQVGCFTAKPASDVDGGVADQAGATAGTRSSSTAGRGGSVSSGGGGPASAGTGSPNDPEVGCQLTVANTDKVDLLFMVDNSGSMREEQEALRRELPKLIQGLTSGLRSDGSTFAPAKDLHLGVVSSDMGLIGIQGIPGCDGLGDDGVMNNVPDPGLPGCPAVTTLLVCHSICPQCE